MKDKTCKYFGCTIDKCIGYEQVVSDLNAFESNINFKNDLIAQIDKYIEKIELFITKYNCHKAKNLRNKLNELKNKLEI